MERKGLLSCAVSVAVGFGCLQALLPSLAMTKTKPGSYAHSASGLEKQFSFLLKSRNSGDPAAFRDGFQILILPDAQNWFLQYFTKDQVQQLADDQEGEVEAFRNSTTSAMDLLMAGTVIEAHCSRHESRPSDTKPRADAVSPIRNVPVEQFRVEFQGKRAGDNRVRSLSMLIDVVYVDGAFRFLGKGALPFWSAP